MRALLLIIFAGLGTQNPDVEIKAFDSFTDCRIEAYRHIEAKRNAQCAAVAPDPRQYPPKPPLRLYMQLWIEPLQAKHGEWFVFHRPTLTTCLPEVDVLTAKGHKVSCRHGGAYELTTAD